MRRFPSHWAYKPHQGPHSDRLWKVYKNVAGPQEVSEGYYVSDTVLDLDADGSPTTRPYTEADHLEQVKKWSTNSALIALEKRMQAFKGEVEQAKTMSNRRLGRFDSRRITDRDILSAAFLGAKDQDRVPASISIPRRISRDIALTVRYLAHRKTAQFGINHQAAESLELESRLLVDGGDPDSIQRILYPLVHLDIGRVLISACAKGIIAGLTKDLGTMSPDQARKIVRFLRNLSYNLSGRNLEFSSSALEHALGSVTERLSTDGVILEKQSR